MSRDEDLSKVREILQRRRREIVEASQGASQELTALKEQERDPEYEEGAQTDLADYTLSSLVEGQRRELMLIDAALQRMDGGTFGTCVDCDLDIPLERLEAMPFAIRCSDDATLHEQEQRGAQGTHLTL